MTKEAKPVWTARAANKEVWCRSLSDTNRRRYPTYPTRWTTRTTTGTLANDPSWPPAKWNQPICPTPPCLEASGKCWLCAIGLTLCSWLDPLLSSYPTTKPSAKFDKEFLVWDCDVVYWPLSAISADKAVDFIRFHIVYGIVPQLVDNMRLATLLPEGDLIVNKVGRMHSQIPISFSQVDSLLTMPTWLDNSAKALATKDFTSSIKSCSPNRLNVTSSKECNKDNLKPNHSLSNKLPHTAGVVKVLKGCLIAYWHKIHLINDITVLNRLLSKLSDSCPVVSTEISENHWVNETISLNSPIRHRGVFCSATSNYELHMKRIFLFEEKRPLRWIILFFSKSDGMKMRRSTPALFKLPIQRTIHSYHLIEPIWWDYFSNSLVGPTNCIIPKNIPVHID